MERADIEQWKAKEVARLLALVETERRYYQEMVASLPVALVVLSADGALVSANRAFRQTFGLRTEDFRRKNLDQIIPSPELAARIGEVIRSGIAQTGLLYTLAKPGGDRPLRIAILAIRNWDIETEIEALLAIEDLTGIQGSASPVLDSVPATIWEASVGREFTYVSTAVPRSSEDWKAPGFFAERIHPLDREATLAYYDSALKPGATVSAEFRWHDDPASWKRETIRVHADGSMTGILTGVTERRLIEQAMIQSQRATALQGVSGKLAHELNNPLMIAAGYLEELLQGLDPSDSRRADAEAVRDAVVRISGVTSQLLSAARVDAPSASAVDVAALVWKLAERIAAGGKITVEAPDHSWALAGESLLEEIVLALGASRGLAALQVDSLAISESIPGSTLRPGSYIRITLRLAQHAEPDPAILESIVGSKDPKGPALARAYGVIREWRGDLTPIPDGFRILLPAAVPIAPVAVPVPEATAPARDTVLVVEDEDGIRALVRKILKRQGYEVLEAANGRDALALAESYPHPIRLLLTDVMMPGMTGIELAGQISVVRPGTRVLFVSGYTDEAALQQLPPETPFLQKPFTLGSLVSKVQEVLRGDVA